MTTEDLPPAAPDPHDIDDALEIAARHGCHPLRGVATYEDFYKLTYVRTPCERSGKSDIGDHRKPT